jgi:hypothetical protein
MMSKSTAGYGAKKKTGVVKFFDFFSDFFPKLYPDTAKKNDFSKKGKN